MIIDIKCRNIYVTKKALKRKLETLMCLIFITLLAPFNTCDCLTQSFIYYVLFIFIHFVDLSVIVYLHLIAQCNVRFVTT